jgi:hypothetical protein
MENELEPRLQKLLKSYSVTSERNPVSARRNQKRFEAILNIIFEERPTPQPAMSQPTFPAWITGLNNLRLKFSHSFARRSVLAGLAILMVLAAFLFGGVGITAYAASSSLPGDALYPLKTTVETLRAGWTLDSASRARLYMEFAARRLVEIQSLMDSDRHQDIPRATREFERDVQRAMDATVRLSQTDPRQAMALNAELAIALRVYNDILNALIASTPLDSQPALQSAIDASQTAADVLLAGQNDDVNDHDSTFDDEDDPSPVPSQTPLVLSTPSLLPNAGQTLQATLTSEPLPTISQPPPATSTSVPVAIPTNTSTGSSSVVPGQDATCQGSIGAVHVANLIVPQGAHCTLNGTRIDGNIIVESGASLTAQQVTVNGNAQAEGARFVGIYGSTVGGSIQIKQAGSASIEGVSVIGDIQFELNNGMLSAIGNQVGGNIQVFKNSSGITIANNTVNGNLQCKENNSAPTGGNNAVQGNKEDQCANM